MTRSFIMKLMDIPVPEERRISKFPKYDNNLYCTPYENNDFSRTVYEKCNQDKFHKSLLKICKIIVIGDVCVGKTCLVNRFCQKVFNSNYKSTIGVDFEVERFSVLDTDYTLQIWDTAGQERFKSIAQSYYRGSHVIIVMFDLTCIKSLINCKNWLNEAMNAVNTTIFKPFVFLVGSKTDLLSKFALKNVETSSYLIATEMNAEYWAVSAKTGYNVDNLFRRIAALTFNKLLMKELEEKIVEIGNADMISFKSNKKRKPSNCMNLKCV